MPPRHIVLWLVPVLLPPLASSKAGTDRDDFSRFAFDIIFPRFSFCNLPVMPLLAFRCGFWFSYLIPSHTIGETCVAHPYPVAVNHSANEATDLPLFVELTNVADNTSIRVTVLIAALGQETLFPREFAQDFT